MFFWRLTLYKLHLETVHTFIHRLTPLFHARFTAMTENSKAIWHFSRQETRGHVTNERRATSAALSSSLGVCWGGISPPSLRAGELRLAPLVNPPPLPPHLQQHLFQVTEIFLGPFRPPCTTSWPCRVALRLRRPVAFQSTAARSQRCPAGRGGGGGRSRLRLFLPEVPFCPSPCCWSAAAGAEGRCKHKWQGDSRLFSAWSSGQNWNRQTHFSSTFHFFFYSLVHQLPGFLRLTCQTDNTNELNCAVWNSIYSHVVAF